MDHLEINRSAWDERARIHVDSKFYDVEGFLAGKTALKEIELAELKDVGGRRLLHLQCHFGLDTLSWARAGAVVTGVDLSPVAIEKARELASRAGLEATFIASDVYDYGEQAKGDFDIVVTTFGTVIWLPDLDRWAAVIAKSLRPGGRFYFADFHPVHDLVTGYPYFGGAGPIVEDEGTYTENAPDTKATMVTWCHPVSAVVNALIDAGIRIDRLNEFPFSPWNCYPDLEEREPGRFYSTALKNPMPLVYSIQGTRTG